MNKPPQNVDDARSLPGRIAAGISEVVSEIPATRERPVAEPREAALLLARRAARRAAMVSGGLAIPPGPIGLLTVLPDILAIWRIQAQLVADVAGLFGKTADLTRTHMLYCLFRHAASQAARDLVVRAGQRILVERLGPTALQRAVPAIGAGVARRLVGSAAARWVPLAGAALVAAYAHYDTMQVAKTAVEVLQSDPIGAGHGDGGSHPVRRADPTGIAESRAATRPLPDVAG